MTSNKRHDELFVRFQKGDDTAFPLLFYESKDKLYSFLFDLTKSKEIAEDMVQNVFLKIWYDRQKFVEVNNFNAYIFRTARNMAIDYIRKYARETYPLTLLHENSLAHDDRDPHDQFIYKELSNKIKVAIDNLPPQQKKVYLLHTEQGLKHDEIAVLMNLSTSTIRNHLMHALSSLRNALSQPLFLFLVFTASVCFKIFFK